MKLKSLQFIFLCIITQNTIAQIDQISVGQGYGQQAYYTLSSGDIEVVNNDAWDISFSALGGQDAGIFINESVGFMGSPFQLFIAPTSDWSEAITATSTFVDSMSLHNPEKNWSEGAFNTLADPMSPFDYGWGAYNPMTHIIEGDRIFVIKNRQEEFFKMQVLDLSSGIYTIRWASLDGDNEKTQSIDKSAGTNGMIHFSFDSESIVDMPSDYDLIFQRYTTLLDAGDDTQIQYTVTGVLTANGVESILVDGVDPLDIDENDYTDQYSSLPTTIGHSWKSFDFSSGWIIDEDRTHFVKTNDGEIYQLTFYDFEGSSTGTTTLEKKLVGTVSSTINSDTDVDILIYPNPTTDFFTISSDTKREYKVSIISNTGQVINTQIVKNKEAVSIENYSTGLYNIAIHSDGFSTIKKLVIR